MSDTPLVMISKLLQQLADEHGIRVDSVRAEWVDVSTVERPAFMLKSITQELTTHWAPR